MAEPEARPSSHLHIARAQVRGHAMNRQAAACLDDGHAFVLVEPRTSPRLWASTAKAVLSGFERGLGGATSSDPHTRVRNAVGAAREALVAFCRTLIERTAPDVNLVAFALNGAELAGIVIGAGRIYRHRRRRTERLSPRELPPEGLLRAIAMPFRAQLAPGTLLFAGTETAFSTEAVARSADMLERDRRVAPSVFVPVLTTPGEQAGTGAAAVALRT